jgi:hypothetical protein
MEKKKKTHKLIRQRIDQLWFTPRQLGLPGKHLYRFLNLTLLEIELCKRSHRRFTRWINAEGFVTTPFRSAYILLPLEDS